MSSHILAVLASVLAVSALSLVGALTLALGFLKRHGVLILLVAFAAGTLLGDSFLHLLPEAVESRDGFTRELGVLVLAGFLAFFLLETGLRWGHAHGEEAHEHGTPGAVAPFAWTNLIGDGIHNFVDGVIIGAAWIVNPASGIATTIAVAAHEIPQELGDFAVLLRAGIRPAKALLYNLFSALLALAGAALVLSIPDASGKLEMYAAPLIAGGFLYIAAADLVPELHHHTERRYVPLILIGLTLGLFVMWLLLGLE